MGISANGVFNGRDGLAKVGGAEADNLQDWDITLTRESTKVKICNAANDVTLAGTVSGSGSFTIFFDPADASHQAMFSLGTADLELYFDGDAVGKSYVDVPGALFTSFGTGISAATPGKETPISFEVGSGGATLETVSA